MRGQADFYGVIDVRPIGMMIHFLSGERDARHKSESFGKVFKLEFPVQSVVFFFPHTRRFLMGYRPFA